MQIYIKCNISQYAIILRDKVCCKPQSREFTAFFSVESECIDYIPFNKYLRGKYQDKFYFASAIDGSFM